MASDFSRTLSLLRREKKISQRCAAEALGVSQALLSHYENGVREPGLSFAVNAANYYRVSLDFLLGRTMHRDGMMILEEDIADISKEKGNVLTGNVSAVLNKKLLLNSTAILYDILGRADNKKVIQYVTQYLSTAFFKMFRMVSIRDKSLLPDVFSVPEICFSELCDSKMKKCEGQLKASAESNESDYDFSPERLQRDYPAMTPALFSVIHSVSEDLKKELE